jgi:DMSO/TMAO reductase YedYZ molybdopterin-dependent catalytic subunit
MAPSAAPRWLYALFGLVATLVGVGAAHLVASLLEPDTSPVPALGSWVVDLGTEGSMAAFKDWAIEQFGENDKVFLQGGIVVGMLVLAVVAGLVARIRWWAGAVVMALMLAAPVAVILTRPVFGVVDLVPCLVAGVVGIGALWLLDRRARGLALRPAPRAEREAADGEEIALHSEPRPTRRGVVVVTAVLTAGAIVLGGAGRLITGVRSRAEDIALPEPARTPPALPEDLSTRYQGITPLRIDDADFYRVDTRLDVPVVDSEGWTLTVDGDVEESFEITFDELLEMEMVERDITLTCVSNSVGGPYVGGARWLGVPLQTIIDRAKPGAQVDQMLATDFDGMTISTPYDLLTDGREGLLCVGMNGEQLSRERGFPVRVVIPGLYGFISATKWVTKLTFTTYAEQEAYWTERGWDTRAPIKPSARIDTPQALGQVDAGKLVVGGVAWAQNDGGVSKVQVQVDGGRWQDATTGPDVNNVYWRQWFFETEVDAGQHYVAARVVDGDGEVQTDAQAKPFPGGSSGIHQFSFTAS